MADDNQDYAQDKPVTNGRHAKREVDLFPALADRRLVPMGAMRQNAPTRLGTQISLFSPVTFDEAIEIVECLRSRAATTISLENMKKIDANRLVDFVAGASAALDGDFHKLSEQVYIFCPSNIKITVPGKAPAAASPFESGSALDFLYPSADTSRLSSGLSWPNA
ncbi:MAG TPA: cell division protein SepF [Candidatus Obscuribacterales bacterium]